MTETPVDSDRELIQQIAQGSTGALHELYNRHGLAMLNYLITELDERPLAEEVLQDVMLAVWQQAAHFRGDSLVRTWLFGITRRQALRARQRRRIPLHASIDDLPLADELHPEADYTDLLDAIEQLPSDQQEALDLVFYRGYSGVEAAAHLNISENTFKSRLFRARRTLRRLLAGKEKDRA